MRGKRGTVEAAMSTLAQLLRSAMEGQSVRQVADSCAVPYWVIRDIVYGRSKKPGRKHLEAIAQGLNLDFNVLVLAAYDSTPQEVAP